MHRGLLEARQRLQVLARGVQVDSHHNSRGGQGASRYIGAQGNKM